MKPAQIVCEAFNVCCPECGEPQPNAHGSELWIVDDLKKKSGRFECISCDAPILIQWRSTARLDPPVGMETPAEARRKRLKIRKQQEARK
jgi:hypothetical protein